MTSCLLEVHNLSKSFPGLKALDGVALTVRSGEVVAVLGPNGSGKSTLVKILAGVYQPDPGSSVLLRNGAEGPAELHFIHQDLGLVGSMSTVENLDLDRKLGWRALMPAHVSAERRRATELIAQFGGEFDVMRPIAEISAAERTIVAMARALNGWSHPANVLILDEPTASLHGDEVDKLLLAVQRVVMRGAGVIFISHRLDEVILVADRVVVLRDGKLAAELPRGGYDHDDLVALIAGVLAHTSVQREPVNSNRIVLHARGISGPTIASLDLDLRAGEIVGISGVLGSGREEVASVLFGASLGQVLELDVDGCARTSPEPRWSIRAGMSYVPADRRRLGAIMNLSARENLTLPRLVPLRRMLRGINKRGEQHDAARWAEKVGLRPLEPDRRLELFSGGNQQKVVLAKWLRNAPKVLLMDEPTQGVDIGAKSIIFELVRKAAAAGTGVLICSSDEKELAQVCDRVLVMSDGRCVAEVSGSELTESALITAGRVPRDSLVDPNVQLTRG